MEWEDEIKQFEKFQVFFCFVSWKQSWPYTLLGLLLEHTPHKFLSRVYNIMLNLFPFLMGLMSHEDWSTSWSLLVERMANVLLEQCVRSNVEPVGYASMLYLILLSLPFFMIYRRLRSSTSLKLISCVYFYEMTI